MPELPEIESLRRYLIAEKVPGRRIVSAELKWPRVVKAPAGPGFLSGVVDRVVEDARRRGKYLVLPLRDASTPAQPRAAPGSVGADAFLIMHMGMTGSLRVCGPAAKPERYAHTILYLDDERRIELNDPRKWASLWLVDDPKAVTGRLGPEPLSPDFTGDLFADRVRGRRARIKTVLMDQSVLAGVGNIYADEALHRAGISPTRRANRISRARLDALHAAIRDALAQAIGFIVEHPAEDGRPFVTDARDERMRLPRRRAAPCPSCGRPLSARSFGGRTAYYCRRCQH